MDIIFNHISGPITLKEIKADLETVRKNDLMNSLMFTGHTVKALIDKIEELHAIAYPKAPEIPQIKDILGDVLVDQADALFNQSSKDERKPIDHKAIGTMGHVPINQNGTQTDAQTERMEAELNDHIDHTQRAPNRAMVKIHSMVAMLMSCATSHMENGDISGSDAITNAIQYARQKLNI